MQPSGTLPRKLRRRRGFSAVDLMIVVLIMGVLTGIGINQYTLYVARSKRPEAVLTFQALAKAQRSYKLTWGKYSGTFDALGFSVGGAQRISPTEIKAKYYTYRLTQPDGPNSWYCLASGNIDGDPFNDILGARNN